MKPEEQLVAIAEWCGLTCKMCGNTGIMKKLGQKEYSLIRASEKIWLNEWPEQEPDIACKHSNQLPDYLNDLNAMWQAEEKLHGSDWARYFNWIQANGNGSGVHATAAQRAEALLRTIGKWKE